MDIATQTYAQPVVAHPDAAQPAAHPVAGLRDWHAGWVLWLRLWLEARFGIDRGFWEPPCAPLDSQDGVPCGVPCGDPVWTGSRQTLHAARAFHSARLGWWWTARGAAVRARNAWARGYSPRDVFRRWRRLATVWVCFRRERRADAPLPTARGWREVKACGPPPHPSFRLRSLFRHAPVKRLPLAKSPARAQCRPQTVAKQSESHP